MIELRLLGPAELVGLDSAAASAVLRQPKRLALVAFLCIAGRTGFVRRDVVLAMFWPELDETRARAALRQALHFLRQHLGDDLVATRGDDLTVAAGRVRADTAVFDEALAAERWTDAAALYRGPLLDGFHVAAVGAAFEDWLARERARLHDGARLAVDDLGRGAEAGGDLWGAVRWARRAVELDPAHEGTARRLMRLLEQGGDHSGALAVYDALARRLHEDRGTAPSAATATVAEACRRADAPVPATTQPAAAPSDRTGEMAAAAPAPSAPAPSPEPLAPASRTTSGTAPWAGRGRGPRGQLRPATRAAVLTTVLAAMAGLGWWAGRGNASPPDGTPVRLVVLPFEEVGQGDGTDVAGGLTEAVTARLASLSRLQVIDPRSAAHYRGARQAPQAIGAELDVGYVLRGTVRWARRADGTPTVQVTPVLVRTGDGAVRWTGAPYVAAPRDLLTVQAEIAADVATALDVTLTRDERRVFARQPTADLQAYRDYMHGLERLREWRSYARRRDLLRSAADLFARAAARDTTFALAYARLAEARLEEYRRPATLGARDPRVLQGAQRALERARRLDPDLPEAVAVHGQYLAWVVRDTAAAFEAFDRASALRPNDADLLVRRVRFPTSNAALDRDAALLERALRLDPRSRAALTQMVVLLGTQRRYPEADHFAARLVAVDPEGFIGYLHGAWAALRARGDTVRAQRLITEGMRRSRAPHILIREFHMLGDGFARALDTLSMDKVITVTPTWSDSISYFGAKLEAAQRLGRRTAVRAIADTLARLIPREPAPQIQALRYAPMYAALGRVDEAHRWTRISEEHSDAQMREMFAGGDTVEARRIQGAVGYGRARVYARTGNAPKMALHLGRALRAPAGVTPYYVRLDPAFRQWHGRPEFEALLTDRRASH